MRRRRCGLTAAKAGSRRGCAIADEAHKQGHILTSEQFHEQFEAAYAELIAPDAT
jgi:hypothetical protein